MVRFGLIVFVSILPWVVSAQEIHVSAGFLKDSVAIGEPVKYYLTARYPQSVMALFPDSTHGFAPFEFGKKIFFPTKTSGGISFDSAVYTLSTFEIDKIQYLSLPVYVTTARDCTAINTAPDSVFLIEQIKIPPSDTLAINNLPLKSNTLYEHVRMQFNTFILLIVLGVLLVIVVVGWILYGKKIIRYFKIRKLQKAYQQFSLAFTREAEVLGQNFSRPQTEHVLTRWKKYLEDLEQKPYTKLTTREVTRLDSDPALGNALSEIDRAIYGHQTNVSGSLEILKRVADQRYHKKLEQIRHE